MSSGSSPSSSMSPVMSLQQQQLLSPAQQQGLRLLQAPVMELRHLVAQELTTNPLLEEVSLSQDVAESLADPWEVEVDFTPLRQESSELSLVGEEAKARKNYLLESFSLEETLSEALEKQCAGWSHHERMLARLIIGSLDSWGYFRMTLEEFAQQYEVSLKEAEKVLQRLQQLDPPGVAARDLRESLLLQLERHSEKGKKEKKKASLAIELVQDHLLELSQHRYHELAKKLHLPLEKILEEVQLIARLEPYPGRAYRPTLQEREVVADMIVWWEGEDLLIRLNEERVPTLKINQEYKQLLAQRETEDQVYRYLKQKIQTGKQFLHHLEERQMTLLRLGEYLIDFQRPFFESGAAAMKPLRLADVATALELHPTTIGRAVANKYLLSPQGILPLRYFFTTSVQGASSTQIKERLRHYLSTEKREAPWSDQELLALLEKEGFNVARRTIAQYRKELGFLAKHLRK